LILTDQHQTETTFLTFFLLFGWAFWGAGVGQGKRNFPHNMEGSMLLSPLVSTEWKLKWRQFLTLEVLVYPVTVPKAKEPLTANLYLNEE